MKFLNQKEITISCINSHGEPIQATILNLNRYSATFEVYNPYSIMQLSEVLKKFQVRAEGKLIYDGNAVVSGLVNTGILVICEVTLGRGWFEADFDQGSNIAAEDRNFASEFNEFLSYWQEIHQLADEFKLVVTDMQSSLIGVESWISDIEVSVKTLKEAFRNNMERKILNSVKDQFTAHVVPFMNQLESLSKTIAPEQLNSYKSYIRRHLHPLILCAPFAFRTYNKPLGYAGDYEMVAMMMRDSFEGSSMFAKLLNHAFLETPPVIAHRNRILYLRDTIKTSVANRPANKPKAKILNLGCGPAKEIQVFIEEHLESNDADFTLLDFSAETLQYTSSLLQGSKEEHSRDIELTFIERSVNQLLKQTNRGDIDMEWESYDLVYCAGLFDYLSQRVCRKLVDLFYKLTSAKGKVIVTNVSETNPCIGWMELVLEWNLIYRDEKSMQDLVPKAMGVESKIIADQTGVNLFLEISKP